MYKYELYEINTEYTYQEKLIAKSNDLSKLRKYATKEYIEPIKGFRGEEIVALGEKSDLYLYENNSGSYHGAKYYPKAVIRVASTDFIIIE